VKRSPLKRTASLRRKTWMRSRSNSKYRRRARDLPYMAWVRTLSCAAYGIGPCSGRIEADHAGRRALSQKADDRTCIPLCTQHHRQRGSFAGPFLEWDQVRMRRWLEENVRFYGLLYGVSTQGVG
jgi:hypothetical protein